MSDNPELSDLFDAEFKSGGRTGGARDCQGLFIEVMRRFGHDVSDIEIASDAVVAVVSAIDGEAQNGKWLPIDEPEPGCAVTLALDSNYPAHAQHLGVYLGGGKFIHILQKRGVLVSRIDDRFFRGKIRGYYRWIG